MPVIPTPQTIRATMAPNTSGGGAAAASRGLASDERSLQSLKQAARQDPKAASREVSRQFEALFLQQVVKSMRAAGDTTGLMDNEASKLGTEMLDSQLVNAAAGKPGGLAEVIQRQLDRAMALDPGPAPKLVRANESLSPVATEAERPRVPTKGAAGFVAQHTEAAKKVEAQSGIPASFMIAQAALETGWGAKEIVGRDGTRSNNLFGIKAGSAWKGPTVDVLTTEYMGGAARKVVQRFRAYASHEASLADYAKLIGGNQRYAKVMESAGDARAFAHGMQAAGYATDPQYGQKLNRVIAMTQRLQRAMG